MCELDLFDPETWPSVLLPREIADMARVSPKRVREWIDEGKLKALKVGERIHRVAKEAFLDYLKRHDPEVVRRIGEQQHAEHLADRKRKRTAAAG